jgi:hypothetical protein
VIEAIHTPGHRPERRIPGGGPRPSRRRKDRRAVGGVGRGRVPSPDRSTS